MELNEAMTALEETTHSFVVRIWCEPREIAHAPIKWRGAVQHVPSGEQRYIENLQDILAFIEPYIEKMGVETIIHQQGH